MEIYAPNNIVRKKMKDHRRRYLKLIGKPTTFQTWTEKALIGVSGFTKFLDVISPRDNILTEEPFKKYIYDKPVPPWPERPYRVERRDGNKEFNKMERSRQRIGSIMSKVRSLASYLDKRKGIVLDEKLKEASRHF